MEIYKYCVDENTNVQKKQVSVKELDRDDLLTIIESLQVQNKQLQEKLEKANSKLKDIKQGLLQTKNQNLYVSPNIFLQIIESESDTSA